jgi:hypothetical protein
MSAPLAQTAELLCISCGCLRVCHMEVLLFFEMIRHSFNMMVIISTLESRKMPHLDSMHLNYAACVHDVPHHNCNLSLNDRAAALNLVSALLLSMTQAKQCTFVHNRRHMELCRALATLACTHAAARALMKGTSHRNPLATTARVSCSFSALLSAILHARQMPQATCAHRHLLNARHAHCCSLALPWHCTLINSSKS